jgi:hypothetical protein
MSRFTERRWFFEFLGSRWGFESSRVNHAGTPYLDRWILYVFPVTLRLHRFWRGDDDRAPHDHPWFFITFPLRTYVEKVFEPFGATLYRSVSAFLPHFRAAKFRHIVVGRADGSKEPFWTLVLSGQRARKWGFWYRNATFVPYNEWDNWNTGVDKENW